jgi:hypothetical protein
VARSSRWGWFRYRTVGLRRIFAWFVIAVAYFLIARNYNAAF